MPKISTSRLRWADLIEITLYILVHLIFIVFYSVVFVIFWFQKPPWLQMLPRCVHPDVPKMRLDASQTPPRRLPDVSKTSPRRFVALIQDVLSCRPLPGAIWRPKLAPESCSHVFRCSSGAPFLQCFWIAEVTINRFVAFMPQVREYARIVLVQKYNHTHFPKKIGPALNQRQIYVNLGA